MFKHLMQVYGLPFLMVLLLLAGAIGIGHFVFSPTFRLDRTVSLEGILTPGAIMFAALSWFQSAHSNRIQAKKGLQESGAVRLVIRLLHEPDWCPTFAELYDRFWSDETKSLRRAYCGWGFRRVDRELFEAFIYQVIWEGHAALTQDLRVILRKKDVPVEKVVGKIEASALKSDAVAILLEALAQPIESDWEEERTFSALLRLDADTGIDLLRAKMSDVNPSIRVAYARIASNVLDAKP